MLGKAVVVFTRIHVVLLLTQIVVSPEQTRPQDVVELFRQKSTGEKKLFINYSSVLNTRMKMSSLPLSYPAVTNIAN